MKIRQTVPYVTTSSIIASDDPNRKPTGRRIAMPTTVETTLVASIRYIIIVK